MSALLVSFLPANLFMATHPADAGPPSIPTAVFRGRIALLPVMVWSLLMVHPASNANLVKLGTTETLLHLPPFGSRHGAHVVQMCGCLPLECRTAGSRNEIHRSIPSRSTQARRQDCGRPGEEIVVAYLVCSSRHQDWHAGLPEDNPRDATEHPPP